VHSSGAGVDLMIVDIPEGLSISMMSFPPTFVLDWNSTDKTKKFKACPLCNC
jgi:hypothetical protein